MLYVCKVGDVAGGDQTLFFMINRWCFKATMMQTHRSYRIIGEINPEIWWFDGDILQLKTIVTKKVIIPTKNTVEIRRVSQWSLVTCLTINLGCLWKWKMSILLGKHGKTMISQRISVDLYRCTLFQVETWLCLLNLFSLELPEYSQPTHGKFGHL